MISGVVNVQKYCMKNLILAIALALGICQVSCKKSDSPQPGGGSFIDYGYKSTLTLPGSCQMIFYDGDIFIGTDDGIWMINLEEKQWKRAGLEGRKITCLYSHEAVNGKFFAGVVSTGPGEKSLYISSDAGTHWEEAVSPVFDSRSNKFEPYYDIRTRPGFPEQVFANLDGTTLAISKDGGLTWNRQNYRNDSYFGIPCVINFWGTHPGEIMQGAEAPLDHAWLGKYTIDNTDPVLTGMLDQFIGRNYEWENRRPNCLETFASNPNALYVGMEGALSKVVGSSWKYLYKAGSSASAFPYTYIRGIWLDPSDSRHLIFGGGVNGQNVTLSLYETYDEGNSIFQIKDRLGMTDPDIIDIVATNTYPAILVRDNGEGNKLRLLLYKPD